MSPCRIARTPSPPPFGHLLSHFGERRHRGEHPRRRNGHRASSPRTPPHLTRGPVPPGKGSLTTRISVLTAVFRWQSDSVPPVGVRGQAQSRRLTKQGLEDAARL